ncbi:MAG: substrate-binding domain-containing protein [Gemmatimonadaceae bacterium]
MRPQHHASRFLTGTLAVVAAACGPSAPASSTDDAPATAALTSAPADTLRIDGSAGVRPLVEALAREYRTSQPAVAIVMGDGLGSKARIEALDEGRIDVAMASHGVDTADLARRGLAAHEIARVAVVFGVNSSVPQIALTEQQVCDVYAGRARNWKALGGPDLPVVPLARPAGEVDADVVADGMGCFAAAIAGREIRTLEQPDEMAATLASTAGAIGMTSLPFVERSEGRIRALALGGVEPSAANVISGRHPLTRQSFLLVRTAPSPAVAEFLAFIGSAAGARVIAASAAVPLS